MATLESLITRINDGNNNTFHELYGLNPADLARQAKRYVSLLRQYKTAFGNADLTIFTSPGRTEIGGNHTDHNYGRVLAGAVNLDNVAVAARNNSNVVHIQSEGYPAFEVDLADLKADKSEQYTSASLVRGICARMQELGYKTGGFNACIDGGVPKGSGLSSSASFEVLVGAIVNELFNDGRMDPIQNAIIGQYAENNYFGKPCGLMDQTACAMGGLDRKSVV
jgi:galactokinase